MIDNDAIVHKYCHYTGANNDDESSFSGDDSDNGNDASAIVGIGAVANGNSNHNPIADSDDETLSVRSHTTDEAIVEAIVVVNDAFDVDDPNASVPNASDPDASDPNTSDPEATDPDATGTNATEINSKDGQKMADEDKICSEVVPTNLRRSTRKVRCIQKSTNDEEGTLLEDLDADFQHKMISPLKRKPKDKTMDRCFAKRQGETVLKKQLDKKDNIPSFFRHWGKLLQDANCGAVVDGIISKVLDENDIKWQKRYVTEEVKMLNLGHKNEKIVDVKLKMKICGQSWFRIKKSLNIDNNEKPYGLFAGRCFKEGEIIGLYMGKYRDVKDSGAPAITCDDDESDEDFAVGRKQKGGKRNQKKSSRKKIKEIEIFRDASNTYAFEHLDAQKGDEGDLYMGIHLINDPYLCKKQRTLVGIEKKGNQLVPNVRINEDFTVEVIRFIRKGSEILTQYFPMSVYENITKIV